MKKVKLAFISAVAIFCFACGQNVEKEVAEMAKSAEDWIKQQETLYSTNGGFRTCEQIGFEFPKSKTFSYECEFKGKSVSWIAENKEDLGDCKAGNKWKISMFVVGKEYGILPEPSIIVPCREITPKSFSNAKKDVSEEAKQEQALAEIEKDPGSLVAELKYEAEIWKQDFRSSINPYKAPESKYFTYKVKITSSTTPWGTQLQSGFFWTATSKMKMGDCPVGSVFEMTIRAKYYDDESGYSEYLFDNFSNKVPAECVNITPEIILNHKNK